MVRKMFYRGEGTMVMPKIDLAKSLPRIKYIKFLKVRLKARV